MITKLTSIGANVMARALDGETITFAAVQLGNGAAQDAVDAEALNNPLLTLGIDEIVVEDRKAALSVSFQNAQVSAGFRWTEAGIFCVDPDDPSARLLYAYGCEPEATADYIAASDDMIQEMQLQFLAYVSDAENVTAIINESTVYATKAAFDAHAAAHNPHGTTAADVGLGNVPNLAPENTAPPFTEPQTLTQTESGDTTGTLFGRLSKGLRSLISHLANTTNHITASERTAWNGKSAPGHKHSASDLISGTLGVARGGTGCTTAKEAGKTLVPSFFEPTFIDSSGNLNNCAEPGFFNVAQGTANAPSGAPNTAGFLLVFQYSTNSVGQLYISYGTGTSGEQKIWFRLKIGSIWNSWT